MDFSVLDHKRDAARAENALTLSFGSELIGMQRDWNEELQSCREFPHSTPQERCIFVSFIQDSIFINALKEFQVGGLINFQSNNFKLKSPP